MSHRKTIEDFLNKIIIGDVLEILAQIPDDIIDLTVTSPPYNKKEKYGGWLVDRVKYKGAKDVMNEEEYQEWQIQVLNEVYRVTKEGGSFFYNHKLRFEDGKCLHPVAWITKSKWTLWQEIIWNRKIAANIRGWRFWQVDERVYWLVKGKPKELKPEHAKLTSIWDIRPEQAHKVHPAPFPIELPARIIYSIMEDNPGIVLDPFCGIGTTLVAAKLLNKDYIGINISEDYVAYAQERLEKAEQEKSAILRETSLHYTILSFQERKELGLAKKRN